MTGHDRGGHVATWPLLAGAMRLIIAVGGAWLMLWATGNLALVFGAPSLALAVFGTLIALSVARGVWFRGANDIVPRSG